MTLKYKIGDHVRIKSIDWYNKNKNDKGDVIFSSLGPVFTRRHSKYAGKVMTIGIISKLGLYVLKEDKEGNRWHDEMFEGLVEEEVSYDTESEWLKHEMTLPEGYIFKDENGNVINAQKIVLEKKKAVYPKTYEECCKILGLLNVDLCFNADYRSFDASKKQWKRLGLMNQFYQLLICRDAYWKIAGEEMGLDGPWKPDWEGEGWYVIVNHRGDIVTDVQWHANAILAFPTEEMRDAFYENFKELIEICKEFL